MALQLWLPLNGNLRNQGLDNIIITNNGATVVDNGVIGKCYSFNGTNNNLTFTPNVDNLSELSVTLWLCPTSENSSNIFFSLERDTYWQVTFRGTNIDIRDDSTGYSGTRKTFSLGSNYTLNTWTHLAITYNAGTLKIYRDGVLLSTNSVGGTRLNSGIGNGRVGGAVESGYYYSGKLNDIRVYDHCLSAKEVKEIAKGLVLHYKLSSVSSIDCSGYGHNGVVVGTLTTSNDSPRYPQSINFGGTQYIHLVPPTTEVKTISLWANWSSIPLGQSVILVDNGSQMGLGLLASGICTITSGAGNSNTFPKSDIVANTWYHFVIIKTGATTRDLYINGVKQTPSSYSNNWTFSINELQLGRRSTSSDGFSGKLSDFREYSTALSEADIRELYNTSAFLINTGVLFGYEFVETTESKINKTGVIESGEFTEANLVTEGMKIFDDKIQANTFNEI